MIKFNFSSISVFVGMLVLFYVENGSNTRANDPPPNSAVIVAKGNFNGSIKEILIHFVRSPSDGTMEAIGSEINPTPDITGTYMFYGADTTPFTGTQNATEPIDDSVLERVVGWDYTPPPGTGIWIVNGGYGYGGSMFNSRGWPHNIVP